MCAYTHTQTHTRFSILFNLFLISLLSQFWGQLRSRAPSVIEIKITLLKSPQPRITRVIWHEIAEGKKKEKTSRFALLPLVGTCIKCDNDHMLFTCNHFWQRCFYESYAHSLHMLQSSVLRKLSGVIAPRNNGTIPKIWVFFFLRVLRNCDWYYYICNVYVSAYRLPRQLRRSVRDRQIDRARWKAFQSIRCYKTSAVKFGRNYYTKLGCSLCSGKQFCRFWHNSLTLIIS